MAVPGTPHFEVFRPLEGSDFYGTEFQEPLTELVHDFFSDVEAAALPIPGETTRAAEMKRLLHSADLGAGRYDYLPSGQFTATWMSNVLVPVSEADSPAVRFQTMIEASMSLPRASRSQLADDVRAAAWITKRQGNGVQHEHRRQAVAYQH